MTLPLIASTKYDWKSAAISPPLNLIAGDTITQVGNELVVSRNGVVAATRTIGALQDVSETVSEDQTITSAIFLRMKPVPGQNVSVVRVFENQNSGSVSFQFSSGTVLEMPNWAEAGIIADAVDATPDLAEKILIGKAFRASPDGANKTNQVGASVSCNLLADTPIVYTEPE